MIDMRFQFEYHETVKAKIGRVSKVCMKENFSFGVKEGIAYFSEAHPGAGFLNTVGNFVIRVMYVSILYFMRLYL